MKILYFAWMREHIGYAEQVLAMPMGVSTVTDLVAYLSQQSEGHARALCDLDMVRVAINRKYADPSSVIVEGDEVAFFPPVTGG